MVACSSEFLCIIFFHSRAETRGKQPEIRGRRPLCHGLTTPLTTANNCKTALSLHVLESDDYNFQLSFILCVTCLKCRYGRHIVARQCKLLEAGLCKLLVLSFLDLFRCHPVRCVSDVSATLQA